MPGERQPRVSAEEYRDAMHRIAEQIERSDVRLRRAEEELSALRVWPRITRGGLVAMVGWLIRHLLAASKSVVK